MVEPDIRFEDGAAYEDMMGVWSRLAIADFDSFWMTSMKSATLRSALGAAASEHVEALKGRLRAHLAADSQGRITCHARAHAIRGRRAT